MTGHDDASGRRKDGPAHEDLWSGPEQPQPAQEGDLDGVEEALALVGHRDRQPAPQAPAGTSASGGTPARHRATSWPDARSLAARIGRSAAQRTRRTALGDALGEVIAEPLVALCDLPSFDTSAMDGWAVAGPGPWRLDAEASILAGHGEMRPLPDGTAVRIATGARVPPGTTAVIRSEHARADTVTQPAETSGTDTQRTDTSRTGTWPTGAQQLYAEREVVPGQDIRPRGQECRSGDQLLPLGSLVTPAVLGLAAAAGYDALVTVARPRVDVLVLGDELLSSGLPHDGLIRDALGPMIGPWLRSLGAEVVATRRVGDDAEALHRAVTTSDADLLITTGGTASGPVDHVHPVLRKAGADLLVDGVAVRPGHPMLLARLAPGRHLVGLPGNPLAAVSGLLTLAEPLLRGLCGRPPAAPYSLPVREAVHGHPQDTRLVPFVHGDDLLLPLHYNGPAMLRGIAAADGLAVVPPGGARPGDELEVLDLPWATWTPPTGERGCFT
ncbi:molybdopterin molybdotransferase MoeA [Streptomyces sp. ISL-10]|uniref:molybdopterin molybdotransferase MoeA n=1 Tax=Streptomyces sp. ISL-10 TaxID=2819172 RepID=UPI001BE4E620|nr:molybdopterin molybdotransferase MoeA [Streptomyces sp. ISL-10]MBT2367312.1 molybdopterin molybdotransferase MoeA [Streptomyces sp. ISL-10]